MAIELSEMSELIRRDKELAYRLGLGELMPVEAAAKLLNGLNADELEHIEEIKGLAAKAYPEIAVPVATLKMVELARAHKILVEGMARSSGLVVPVLPARHAASVAQQAHSCGKMCPECPWRHRAEGTAPWTAAEHAKLEHHAINLGGFACHMTDGDGRSFSLTERTTQPCLGWKKAGGDLAAIRRRWRVGDPRFDLDYGTGKTIHHVLVMDEVKDLPPAPYIPPKTFRCPACRRVSHNKKDVENSYCGACRRFFK